jgi:hypothetical protein
MEATDTRTSRTMWWYVRHPLATRWTRVPIIFLVVLAATMLLALAFRSNWVECRSIEEWYAQTCPVLPRRLLFIRVIAILGVATMILGPLLNSLYQLFRYGQPWETTRHETIVSNIPIVAGFAYVVIALIIAWM